MSEPSQAGLSQTQAVNSSIKAGELPKREPTAYRVSVKQEAAESLSQGDMKAESSIANSSAMTAAAEDNKASLANGTACNPLYSKGSR